MKVYTTPDIRNVALVGHGDSGKTSLTSGLLFTAGAVTRLGKVDDGTALTDFDEEEIARKVSIHSALAHLEWKSKKGVDKRKTVAAPAKTSLLEAARVQRKKQIRPTLNRKMHHTCIGAGPLAPRRTNISATKMNSPGFLP